MDALNPLKIHMINKYLGYEYKLFDLTARSDKATKMEFTYINNIIFKSLKKNLSFFTPLALFGSLNKTQEELINKLNTSINKWEQFEYTNNQAKQTDLFIKNYEVDIQEVENYIYTVLSKTFAMSQEVA